MNACLAPRPALLLALALLAAACGPRFDFRRLAKPTSLGEEQTADINLANPNLLAIARKLSMGSEGKITIDAKPTNNKAKLSIKILAEAGGTVIAEGESPLEADGITPGLYYFVVQSTISTRVKLNIGYSPKDGDVNSGPDGNVDTPAPLNSGRPVAGSVNNGDLDKTDYFLLDAKDAGTIKFDLKLTNLKGKVTGAVQPPKANDFTPIDLRQGLTLADTPAGPYIVRVQAEDNSSANYQLSASNEAGDPDKNSGDDATQDGATALQFRPGVQQGQQVASAKDEVSYDKGDATDWFVFNAPDKGKCSVVLKKKVQASKVKAEYVVSSGQDDGAKVTGGFTGDCDKGPRWVKVVAENRGDATAYTVEVTFIPSIFIGARVLELDKKAGCAVWVDKGTNDQVRQGSPVAFVSPNGMTLANGFVDQPPQAKMSHVKVSGTECNLQGTQVQISGGGY
jgi:hypothetical protein